MSEDPTKNLPTNLPFEERVMALLQGIDQRLQKLESKQYDTKPIWERALKEIMELRQEMNERFDEMDERIAVLSDDMVKVRARVKTVPLIKAPKRQEG